MLDHLQKTMAKMFNIAFVVILMDLPVLVVLTVKKVPFSIPKCVVARVGTVAIMAVYLLTVVLPTTPVDMVTALQRSEIFSFHGHDVRNFLTGYNSVQALEALAENGDTKESMSGGLQVSVSRIGEGAESYCRPAGILSKFSYRCVL
ncbi:MAG: hypothetical protein ACLR23_13345 [Clostridia bacterium]